MELVGRARSLLIANTWTPTKAAILERVASRPVTIDGGQRIVSFSFDDVPQSVLANAAPVLDEYGVKATFYVALRMSGGRREFLREDDVRMLAARGHHIGCHTLTHYSLRRGTAQGLYEDAVAGKHALESAVGGGPVEHFSWPYGAVSVRAKTLLQRAFVAMRTSTPGVNRGRVDLSYLRAENLYSRRLGVGLHTVRRVVRSVGRRGGWIIFYTHGVCDDPGEYETRGDDFRRVMEIVAEANTLVLPVSKALGSIGLADQWAGSG